MIAKLYLREEYLLELQKALRDGAEWMVKLESGLFEEDYTLIIDFGDKDINSREVMFKYSHLRVSHKSRLLPELSEEHDAVLPEVGETIILKFNNKQRRELLRFKHDFTNTCCLLDHDEFDYDELDYDCDDYDDYDDYSC